MNHTCLYSPAARRVTALWLILIAPTHEGMARLSWPGWLVTYRDKCPSPGIEPGYGHPLQYSPGPTLINFVDRSQRANHYARPPTSTQWMDFIETWHNVSGHCWNLLCSEVNSQGHSEIKCTFSRRRHTFRRCDVEGHLFSYSVSQKSRPNLKLFAIFSLLLNLCNWEYYLGCCLTIFLHVYQYFSSFIWIFVWVVIIIIVIVIIIIIIAEIASYSRSSVTIWGAHLTSVCRSSVHFLRSWPFRLSFPSSVLPAVILCPCLRSWYRLSHVRLSYV